MPDRGDWNEDKLDDQVFVSRRRILDILGIPADTAQFKTSPANVESNAKLSFVLLLNDCACGCSLIALVNTFSSGPVCRNHKKVAEH